MKALMLARRAVPIAAVSLVASACVWPVPLPGDPVPSIESTSTWNASTETITLEVSVVDLNATIVSVYPKGLGSAPMIDTAAPFAFDLDAGAFAIGDRQLFVTATNGTTIVAELEPLTVTGCNGSHELCSRSYDEVRYLTAHNAMSNAADGWIGPNQNLDVPGQLELGVRGLMLDTYRAGDLNGLGLVQVPGVNPNTPYLCHVFCSIGSQPLVEGLVEIRTFLDANPGAVVTLILESYLSHPLTAGAFSDAGLLPYAYIHPGGAWPTLGEMIDSGERLVVLQDKSVNPSYPWLMNVWTHAFETHFSAAAPQDFSCAANRGVPSNDLFILNHFLTQVFGSAELAALVNGNPNLINRATSCEALHSTVANFVTVDFVDIGDPMSAVHALNDG